jgi:beta-keto acid cleavage enzyme
VNFNEPGSVALAELLISRGVGVEAGLGSVLAVENLVGSKIGPRCLRALLEPEEQDMGAAVAVIGFLEAFLNRGAVTIPRLLHGYEATAWDFVGLAAARGYDTRIGFEDTVVMPDGALAPGNEQILAEAVRLTSTISKGASAK